MSDKMDSRLVETLHRRAEIVADGPRFAVDDLLGAGRAALRRRTRARLAAAAITVVVILLAAGGVLAAVRQPGRHPIQPDPADSASPTPDLVAGNVLVRADGLRTPVTLPTGWTVGQAARIPNGWIVNGAGLDSSGTIFSSFVWLLPDGGAARRIGKLEDFRVSPTGNMVAGVDDKGTVVAYTLPGLTKIGQTAFATSNNDNRRPWLGGISRAGLVLVSGDQPTAPTRAAVWNPATGAMVTSDAPVRAWGITDDGRVLRSTGVDADGEPLCIDLVTIGATFPSDDTGLCAPQHWAFPQVSPDGQWVTMRQATADGRDTAALLRVADLRAGRSQSIALDIILAGYAGFWDSATTFLLTEYDALAQRSTNKRCDIAGHCRPIDIPAQLTNPRPVPRFGP